MQLSPSRILARRSSEIAYRITYYKAACASPYSNRDEFDAAAIKSSVAAYRQCMFNARAAAVAARVKASQ